MAQSVLARFSDTGSKSCQFPPFFYQGYDVQNLVSRDFQIVTGYLTVEQLDTNKYDQRIQDPKSAI